MQALESYSVATDISKFAQYFSKSIQVCRKSSLSLINFQKILNSVRLTNVYFNHLYFRTVMEYFSFHKLQTFHMEPDKGILAYGAKCENASSIKML